MVAALLASCAPYTRAPALALHQRRICAVRCDAQPAERARRDIPLPGNQGLLLDRTAHDHDVVCAPAGQVCCLVLQRSVSHTSSYYTACCRKVKLKCLCRHWLSSALPFLALHTLVYQAKSSNGAVLGLRAELGATAAQARRAGPGAVLQADRTAAG